MTSASGIPWPPPFLESLPVAAYTCDHEGLITGFNRLAVKMWGREPRINDPFDRYCGSFRLFTPDGTPLPHESCWMALALRHGREYIGQEVLIERPDGERVLVLTHVSPHRDSSGRVIGAINLLTDVRSHRDADSLRARLAAIVECSDDAIISKALNGTIETWNHGAERLFGYTATEAIGQPITLIIPPDRWDEEREILARLTRGERIDHLETVRVSKSGERLFISLTTSPLFDTTGRVVGASKVARDITGRKRSDLALKSLSEQRERQLMDMARLRDMGDRMWTAQELKPILFEALRTAASIEGTDLGIVTMWDRERDCAVLGSSLGLDGEFLSLVERLPLGNGGCGRSWAEGRRVVIGDIDLEPSFDQHRDAARAARIRSAHCTPLVTRAGEVVGVLTTYFRERHVPSRREMDLVDLCASQAVDFIENAQMRNRLREDDERKNQFLAVLAHELRNPLAPIRNALELIRNDSAPRGTFERAHAVMERQVHQMVRLIDDLMDVSRLTRGQLVLRKAPTTLSAALEIALESCRPAIDAAGHRFTSVLPDEPIALEADVTRLAQVFTNLLGNAAKYTRPGGHIAFEAECLPPDRVRIRVRDDGIGIQPSSLERIFEMYSQVGSALDRSGSGLGIGLSVARGLVALHGGTITAQSEGLGHGSEFIVELPMMAAPRQEQPERPEEARNGSGATRTRILIVDDNLDAAFSFSQLVSRMGHETQVAHDGIDAVRLASEFRPEIVFLDIGLPRLNGYDVARAVRKESWGRSIYLVALTGWGQEKDKRESAESGIDLHLVKPLNPTSVSDLIERCRLSREPESRYSGLP